VFLEVIASIVAAIEASLPRKVEWAGLELVGFVGGVIRTSVRSG